MVESQSFRLPSESGSRTESLIDRESHFTGTYRTPHDLRIEGHYEGEIVCQGTVFIGETADVNARITAGTVIVAGQCQGEIACDARFEILRTGRVSGTVSAGVTVVHDGAFYQGELRMTRGGNGRLNPRGSAEPNRAPARQSATVAPEPAPARPAEAAASEPVAPRTPPPANRRRSAESGGASAEPEIPSSLISGAAQRANGSPNGRGAGVADEDASEHP